MPTPVVVVASGGMPIVNTTRGTPMTPVATAIGGTPVTIVADVANIGGVPVNLVKEDLTPWP
jgi:hypothetical protein